MGFVTHYGWNNGPIFLSNKNAFQSDAVGALQWPSMGGSAPGGVCLRGVYLGRRLPRGVCLGGCLPREVSRRHPLWTE